MADDLLGYGELVEEAMMGVVRKTLDKVAKDGLPGKHHFYLTYRTDHPGVELPDHLRQRYPREITVVLQHQFWNLKVSEEAVDVDLSFNQKLEHLCIPFEALLAFADPAVNFAVQLHGGPMGDAAREEEAGDEKPSAEAAPAARKADVRRPAAGKGKQASDRAAEAASDKSADGGDNVVTLDAFRKK